MTFSAPLTCLLFYNYPESICFFTCAFRKATEFTTPYSIDFFEHLMPKDFTNQFLNISHYIPLLLFQILGVG